MLTTTVKRTNLISSLMEERKMTIYALAKATGMPWHNAATIAQSEAIPPGTEYKTLLKIAEALGVKIDDLEVVSNGQ